MAKIGTAHVEIKPVISDDVLEAITDRIASAVALGVERGMAAARPRPMFGDVHIAARLPTRSAADADVLANVIRERAERHAKRRGPE